MAVTEKEILSDIKNNRLKPVYLITGEEGYYIDMVSDYFENMVVDEASRDFDQTVVYGMDVDMSTVISYARQFPILSPTKLVMVKEAQDIKVDRWDSLIAYLDNPQPSTVLVFVYRHKSFDKRTKVYKAINTKGVVYEKKKLYENEIPRWINQHVQENGFSITENAANLISDSIGNDLDKISNELRKLYLALEKGTVITDDAVEHHIGISKTYNVFELQKAIGRRDALRCNRIVNHFAANPKEMPIQMLIPTLYSYFIKVMIYHQTTDKSQAASAMGISPYFLSDYETAASNYSLGKLATCIGYLHNTDLRSKGVNNTGATPEGELLKELIFKIIH